jgi:hypothetical protein
MVSRDQKVLVSLEKNSRMDLSRNSLLMQSTAKVHPPGGCFQAEEGALCWRSKTSSFYWGLQTWEWLSYKTGLCVLSYMLLNFRDWIICHRLLSMMGRGVLGLGWPDQGYHFPWARPCSMSEFVPLMSADQDVIPCQHPSYLSQPSVF